MKSDFRWCRWCLPKYLIKVRRPLRSASMPRRNCFRSVWTSRLNWSLPSLRIITSVHVLACGGKCFGNVLAGIRRVHASFLRLFIYSLEDSLSFSLSLDVLYSVYYSDIIPSWSVLREFYQFYRIVINIIVIVISFLRRWAVCRESGINEIFLGLNIDTFYVSHFIINWVICVFDIFFMDKEKGKRNIQK